MSLFPPHDKSIGLRLDHEKVRCLWEQYLEGRLTREQALAEMVNYLTVENLQLRMDLEREQLKVWRDF